MKIAELIAKAIEDTYPDGETEIYLYSGNDVDGVQLNALPENVERVMADDPCNICAFDTTQPDLLRITVQQDHADLAQSLEFGAEFAYPMYIVWKDAGAFNFQIHCPS